MSVSTNNKKNAYTWKIVGYTHVGISGVIECILGYLNPPPLS